MRITGFGNDQQFSDGNYPAGMQARDWRTTATEERVAWCPGRVCVATSSGCRVIREIHSGDRVIGSLGGREGTVRSVEIMLWRMYTLVEVMKGVFVPPETGVMFNNGIDRAMHWGAAITYTYPRLLYRLHLDIDDLCYCSSDNEYVPVKLTY
jgi:hypothetical protein